MRMAESRRYISNQPLDITQILFEAKHRWLRPNEICEILRNYQKFELTPDPPYKPSGGSLYLFDRKALRYFRKDGHCWRKKKDGKTVREAHEKLKAGSVDVLHCYYAHGEDNENFQRRSYWMLDLQFEHIVLVHYREVKEGNKPGIPHFLNGDPGLQIESTQACSMVPLAQLNSPAIVVQTSYASSPSNVDWNGRTSHSEFEDVDSGDELVPSAICSRSETASLHMHDLAGLSSFTRNYFDMGFGGPSSVNVASPSSWYGNQSSSNNISCLQEQKMSIEQPNGTSIISSKTVDVVAPKDGIPDSYLQTLVKDSQIFTQKDHKYDNSEHADYNNSDKCLQSEEDGMFQLTKEQGSQIVDHMFYDNSGSLMPIAANSLSFGVEKTPIEGDSNHDVSGELKKLDSFGRWMNKELGKDCDDSLMASDSGNYWNALDTQNDEKEVSSLSHHMQLDIDSLGPSLSKEQLFSIRDFSPDWAYSGVGTKVLVSGKLLGDVKQPRTTKWCCMFGEVEIPAEVLSDGVLRCQAPPHTSGRVPFYITCSNRLACSEVREFEYREKPLGKILSVAVKSEPEDEMRLQIRFTKILYLGSVRKRFNCSVDKCDKCITKTKIFSMRGADDCEWGQIEKLSKSHVGNRESPGDALMQKLLKDRLYEWLATKVHEGDKGPLVLDDEGQGVIHLAAALGYEWALHPIIAAGVSPSFRDAQGRSGLHWAAYYGREETVAALVRLGAAPGAVEDPTSKFPGGRTAADFASSRGHKGIAGYLAEADLTSHLSSLTLKENVLDSVTATIAAEEAVETVEEQTIVPQGQGGDSQRSLKGSLAAVRKSAQAAALIQAAFRARSFRHRQLSKSDNEICDGSTDLAALASLNNKAPKLSHYSNYLHASAVKIQQKYRGWKGRNEYLKIRNRIVKIQAHIRGHQVRKQYKKVVWSVSIVEKAILRWRRKGAGLRGFQPGKTIEQAQQEMEKTDEYEFLRLGRKQKVAGVEKALARVQSMVRYPEAREQYMRLVTNYQKLKSAGEGVSTILQPPNSEKVATDDDLLALPSMTA